MSFSGYFSHPPLNWTLYELAAHPARTISASSSIEHSSNAFFSSKCPSWYANVPTKQSPAPTVSTTSTFGQGTRFRWMEVHTQFPTSVPLPMNAPSPPSVIITTNPGFIWVIASIISALLQCSLPVMIWLSVSLGTKISTLSSRTWDEAGAGFRIVTISEGHRHAWIRPCCLPYTRIALIVSNGISCWRTNTLQVSAIEIELNCRSNNKRDELLFRL